MMRSFENRPDAVVVDEPFYAAYLASSGADHPMKREVLRSQPNDWASVVRELLGDVKGGRQIFYQKHMTHHMLPQFGREWISSVRNAFLIRAPEDVLLSYAEVRGFASLEEIGVQQQRDIFEREADRLGTAPPVLDSYDVLQNPRDVLKGLCAALGISFVDEMLVWPAGRRSSDGVWAPAWYASVEQSTGFATARPRARGQDLPDALRRVADAARADYERLAAFKISASTS